MWYSARRDKRAVIVPAPPIRGKAIGIIPFDTPSSLPSE